MLKPAHLRCFSGEEARGNLHVVVFVRCEQPSSFFKRPLSSFADISKAMLRENLVVVQAGPNEHTFFVRFFENQKEILRCGSGSLAAIFYLRNHVAVKAGAVLKTIAGDVHVGEREGGYYFTMKPLPYYFPAQKLKWDFLTEIDVKNTLNVGGSKDYCLLELADEGAVKSFRFNPRLYSLLSKRALIVTAANAKERNKQRMPSAVSSKVDYVLRYFLPQYGKYEDDATGSANAMVAAYWQRVLAKKSVRGYQCSSRGGQFLVEYKCGLQYVYGEVIDV